MCDQGKGEDEEQALFRAAMRDVVPLRDQNRAAPWRPRLSRRPLERPEEDLHLDDGQDLFSDQELETGEELAYFRPGLQLRVFQELRRGQFAVGLELDLHGLTVQVARGVLQEFLTECRLRRVRCARIIHGKGLGSEGRQPILKQKLNLWLRQREEILAFCSATSRDGGTGAAYVLLRSPNKTDGKKQKR